MFLHRKSAQRGGSGQEVVILDTRGAESDGVLLGGRQDIERVIGGSRVEWNV